MELKDLLRFFRENTLLAFICALVIVGSVVVPLVVYFNETSTKLSDFERYYNTARTILDGNGDLIYNYEYTEMDYRYFPSFAIIIIPFALLDLQVAYVLFILLNMIVFVFGIKEMRKIGRLIGVEINHVILVIIILPSFSIVLIMGQNVLLVVTMIMFSFRSFLENKVFSSGIFLGISSLLKPVTIFIMILMLVTFFRKRNFKMLLKFFLGVIIPLIPDIIIFASYSTLLHSFVSSSIFHSDFRTDASSISLISFFYYVFDIKFIYFVVPGLIILLPYFYKKQDIEKCFNKEDTIKIFTLGTVLHFVFFVDIWHSQLVIVNFFISLLWSCKGNWKDPLKPVVFIDLFLLPMLFIPINNPIGTMFQFAAIFIWVVVVCKALNYHVPIQTENTQNSIVTGLKQRIR